MKNKFESSINALVNLYESTREERLKWNIEGYCSAIKDAGYILKWNNGTKRYEVEEARNADRKNS